MIYPVHTPPYRHTNSRGSALLLGVVILIVLSMLAVFSSSSGILQEKMTGNYSDDTRSLEAAELGLRWAETWLAAIRDPLIAPSYCDSFTSTTVCSGSFDISQAAVLGNDGGGGGMPDSHLNFAELPFSWWQANAFPLGQDPLGNSYATGSGSNTLLATTLPDIGTPMIYIEHLFFDPEEPPAGEHYYRITSRAGGKNSDNVSIVQSVLRRRYQ